MGKSYEVPRIGRVVGILLDDRVLLVASLWGGQALSATWLTFMHGASLVSFPAVENGVTGLAEWMIEKRVSIFVSASSLFRHFMKTVDAADIWSIATGRAEGRGTLQRLARPAVDAGCLPRGDRSRRYQACRPALADVISAGIGIGIACGVDLKTCAQIVQESRTGVRQVHGSCQCRWRVLCARFSQSAILDDRRGVGFRQRRPRATQDNRVRHDLGLPRRRELGFAAWFETALEVADRVIIVGPHSGHIDKLLHRGIAKDRLFGFQTTYQASEFIGSDEVAGELIYVKASVAQHLERLMLAQLDEVVYCGSAADAGVRAPVAPAIAQPSRCPSD